MIKMSRKAKKAMAVALTAGMLASTAVTPVMAATQGWKQNSKGWWYQNADGSYPANKWSQINGKWYYFDANGYMLANSWVKDKAGKWYFVGADGAMKTNAWAKDKAGLWYWLTGDGSMFEGGWARINGEWYFFQNNGVMQSGVIKVNGETYYLGSAAEGWMHTGKVDVAGTQYNFDAKSGACTDAKAPAAAKAFDKTGKEIENKVDIEAVDGITGKITNALPDYQADYGNVLIAGSDAYLKVLVSDKDGNPVVNTPVSLMSEYKLGSSRYTFGIKGLSVQTTDANGYATFVIGTTDSDVTPTSGDYALLSLTATAVATNQVYKTDLSFATVDLGAVDVLNDNDPKDALLVKPSQNASATTDATPITKTIDGKSSVEYVATQQVNEKNTTTNKVQLKLDPQIKIPVANTTSVVDKYQQDVNKEIKEYSVYQNGGSTSFKVEKIPAGLKYATLNFSSIDVSDYTKVVITAYKSGTSTVVDTYEIDGPTTQKNFGYQIPVQKNDALDIEVKVISEGQVDDNQNAGLVVTNVTGLYDTKTSDTTKSVSLKDSVTWSVVENQYSNAKTLTAAQAAAYIPDELDAKYTAEGNTYTYQVPVFPYTGNAILTVKDVNKKVVGYFTIPTENITKTVGTSLVYQNENDIVAANNQAILVSKDEAFNNVGAITPNGNVVEVNSEVTGITALQAKINLAGFEDQINLTNNTVYTSVHWSPIPNTVKAVESQDFYALVGQNITVKAQLVDNNGNKVSQSGQQITYAYDTDNKVINALGAVGTTKTTATAYTATTDANGQATLKLASGDQQALVNLLHATSASYNVQLMIGDTIVTNANLRWVEPGLAFTSSVDKNDTDYEKAITLDSTVFDATNVKTSELKTALAKDTGSNWIFGYEVIGETQDDTSTRWVDSISGLKVDITKGGAGDITTTGMDNGVAKITSNKAGATILTGTIDEKSVVSGTDVVFKVATKTGTSVSYKDYKNVGEGTPSIGASLNLPVTWGTVGTAVKIVSPKGTSLIVDADQKAYVKVVDEFGNVKAEENVEVTVTYSNGTSTSNRNNVGTLVEEDRSNITVKTDINGLVPVTILANAGFTPTTATISAKVGNETTQQTIQYKIAPTNAADFAVGTAKYVSETSTSNPKVEVIFTKPVNKESLNKEMFTITYGTDDEVAIAKAELDSKDNNKVILTLADQHKNGLANGTEYTVKISDRTVDGIEYSLCDTYGRTVNAGYKSAVFKTVASKIEIVPNSTYPTDITKCTIKANGGKITGNVVWAYDGAEELLVADNKGLGNQSLSSNFDLNRAALTKPLTVTFYYNGDVVTKTFDITAAEIASNNTNDINTDIGAIDTALVAMTGATATTISPASYATKGTTVKVTELADFDANSIISVSSNKITVTLGEASKDKTALFDVEVSKSTGTTVTKTYKVEVNATGDKYTITEVVGTGLDSVITKDANNINTALVALTSTTVITPANYTKNGTTVTVTVGTNADDVLAVDSATGKVTVTTTGKANKTGKFTVKVDKGSGATAQNDTYTVTVNPQANGYTITKD